MRSCGLLSSYIIIQCLFLKTKLRYASQNYTGLRVLPSVHALTSTPETVEGALVSFLVIVMIILLPVSPLKFTSTVPSGEMTGVWKKTRIPLLVSSLKFSVSFNSSLAFFKRIQETKLVPWLSCLR